MKENSYIISVGSITWRNASVFISVNYRSLLSKTQMLENASTRALLRVILHTSCNNYGMWEFRSEHAVAILERPKHVNQHAALRSTTLSLYLNP